jgi:hypothetical protein
MTEQEPFDHRLYDRRLQAAIQGKFEADGVAARAIDRERDAHRRLREAMAERDRWRARCPVTALDVTGAKITDADAAAVLASKGWTSSVPELPYASRDYIDLRDAQGQLVCSLRDDPGVIAFAIMWEVEHAVSIPAHDILDEMRRCAELREHDAQLVGKGHS